MIYFITVKDGIKRFCPSCNTARYIYGTYENLVILICCGTCQRILYTEKI